MLNVHAKIEISVESAQEEWCKPVEEFAAAIGTEKGWSSVITNSGYLPKEGITQHEAGTGGILAHLYNPQFGESQGTWKRTWTLKPLSQNCVENASGQVAV